MALNEAKGNMYDWVTHTWNTVKGACPHDCSYCYMKRWGKLKPVRFDEKELKTDLGSGNFIFVGSSCDMFANDIPSEWIEKTINHLCKFNNTYLFQSKNPIRFVGLPYVPEKSRFCTTIETNRIYPQMAYSPTPFNRASAMYSVKSIYSYVTIEPIMDFDLDEMVGLIRLCEPCQVNIGSDSGNNNLPEPSGEKVLRLIEELQKFTTIARKTNLKRLIGNIKS